MSNTIFHHVRVVNRFHEVFPRGGVTLALEPIQGWHFKQIEKGTFFEKAVGKAECSMKDNYCKKTGRDIAVSRMKNTKLTAELVIEDTEGRMIHFRDSKDNSLYAMIQYKDSDRVYLAGYLPGK